jgi:hypothetical protein
MKKTITVLIILLVSGSLIAETLTDSIGFPFNDDEQRDSSETQTLFNYHDIDITGYGGPYMSTTEINGKQAYFMGGRGAALIGRTFIIGGGGMGLLHPESRSDLSGQHYGGELKYVNMGYGGAIIGLALFQPSILNLSATTLIGGGGLVFSNQSEYDEEHHSDSGQYQNTSSKVEEFFIAEPEVMMHLNLTRWMRIGVGLSYRYTYGINNNDFSDEDFRNLSAVFAAEFGWF